MQSAPTGCCCEAWLTTAGLLLLLTTLAFLGMAQASVLALT
jgi:hypothetical protein